MAADSTTTSLFEEPPVRIELEISACQQCPFSAHGARNRGDGQPETWRCIQPQGPNRIENATVIDPRCPINPERQP